MRLINNHLLHFVYPICISLVTGVLPALFLSWPHWRERILINVIGLSPPDLLVQTSVSFWARYDPTTRSRNFCRAVSAKRFTLGNITFCSFSSRVALHYKMITWWKTEDITMSLFSSLKYTFLPQKASFNSSDNLKTFPALNPKGLHIRQLADIVNAWHHDQRMPLIDICFCSLTHNKTLTRSFVMTFVCVVLFQMNILLTAETQRS